MDSGIEDPREPEAWEQLGRAAEVWLGVARSSYDPREQAVARVLALLFRTRAAAFGDALESLSEWARDQLDPGDVAFSAQRRGAQARYALERVVQALRADDAADPSAPLDLSRLIILSAAEREDISREWSGGNERRRRRPQVRSKHLEQPGGNPWMDRVTTTLWMEAGLLVPATLQAGDANVTAEVRKLLTEGRADGGDALAVALRKVPCLLARAGVQAPLALRLDLVRAVVECQRSTVDATIATADPCGVHRQARALLRAVLRAWGLPDAQNNALWRADERKPAPDPPRGAYAPSRIMAFPMDEPHAAARRLYFITSLWTVAAEVIDREPVQRVQATLRALAEAWIAKDTGALVAAGARAVRWLDGQPDLLFLLDVLDHAAAVRATLAPFVQDYFAELATSLPATTAPRPHLRRVARDAAAALVPVLAARFPLPPPKPDGVTAPSGLAARAAPACADATAASTPDDRAEICGLVECRLRGVLNGAVTETLGALRRMAGDQGHAAVRSRSATVLPGADASRRQACAASYAEDACDRSTRAVLRAVEVPEPLVKNLFQKAK